MAKLDAIFHQMRQSGSTDLHLAAGAPPRVRARGELEPLGTPPMSGAELHDALVELLSPSERDEFAAMHDVEFTYALPGVARFRGSYFVTLAGPAAVFRLVPETGVPLESLALPPAFEGLLEKRTGLVLVSAPLGAGRSTLFASVVDRLNASGPRRIVAIEDPIELVQPKRTGVVMQREVGRDCASVAAGIRGALRLDVEVLCVAELPDAESTRLALHAAEGGRLVIAFPAVPGAQRTIERLVESFPASEQAEIGALLADNLLGILAQVLLRRKDGPARVAAHELLLASPDLASALRDADLRSIGGVIEAGKGHGMQTMDDAIDRLLKAGVVTPEEAHRKATEKSRFAVSSAAR